MFEPTPAGTAGMKWKQFFMGTPRNLLDPKSYQHVSLIALFAWIGLGADGLSSSAYGPEQAFIALGQHHYLAFYLAIITGVTVFIISVAYNQVIELFPSGGGGYKVATSLLGARAGLVSGAALIVDYVLTITISIASGVDALFSLLPSYLQAEKLVFEAAIIIFLMFLNIRGMKETIKFLLPIFFIFVATHLFFIIYGISLHASYFDDLVRDTIHQTHEEAKYLGWFFILSLLLRAYSLGGSTYTGLEAVSNNVNRLAEPRVRTGKWTMFYMAVSLSVTAAGIILLYLLWYVHPQYGQTLNAVAFNAIAEHVPQGKTLFYITMLSEALLLFVAANTGYLGGPAVLGNMAMDNWVPKRFSYLSSRLVTQNGIMLFAVLSLVILIMTLGHVGILVVLYSMNVFLTFAISLFGLCVYWWKHRKLNIAWLGRFSLSVFGFFICFLILGVTLSEKFMEGGWLTIAVTSSVIFCCVVVKRRYKTIASRKKELDDALTLPADVPHDASIPLLDKKQPTAVFLIGESIGEGMHTLLQVQRMFPNHFKNFLFISVGIVDVGCYGSEKALNELQENISERLDYFVNFSHKHGYAAAKYAAYGSNMVRELMNIAKQIEEDYSNTVYFAATLVSKSDNWLTRRLNFDIANILQRFMHQEGKQLIILPVNMER